MISAIIAFLGIIPGVSTVIGAIMGKMYDAKVAITTARIGGDVSVATAMVNASIAVEASRVQGLTVIAGSWVLSFLVVGFATPFIIYEWKVVVWDTVLMWGVTNPIRGAVIDWGGTIIMCLFGSGTALSTGHMYFNRNKTGE